MLSAEAAHRTGDFKSELRVRWHKKDCYEEAPDFQQNQALLYAARFELHAFGAVRIVE